MLTADIAYYTNQIKEFRTLIEFYNDEIKVLEKRLMEVTEKNTRHEVLFRVEHFQNQLIVQREQFDLLLHDAGQLQKEAVKISKHEQIYIADFLMDHNRFADKVNTASGIFRDIKHECYRFLSSTL